MKWKNLLWAINAACCLIFVRSVYRLVEFSLGQGGYLTTHEWNFYVFESAIIVIVIAIFNVFHPAQYLTNIGWRQISAKRGKRGAAIEDYEMGHQGGVDTGSQ